MNWQEISGNWVHIPPRTRGIIHFLGGAFLAAAPQVTYRWLLEQLSLQGYAIIATPFVSNFDHGAIAADIVDRFEWCVEQLRLSGKLPKRYLPIYGIGHSMGCKLHLLIGSLFDVDRAGNILISYNNYPARRSIPFLELVEQLPTTWGAKLPQAFSVEFTPSPEETNDIIARNYQIKRNLIVKFKDDTLDQTLLLFPVMQERFPDLVSMLTIPGNHLTPLSQDPGWKSGTEFSPLDAIAQWVRLEMYREPVRLKDEIIRWLNPIPSMRPLG